MRLEKLHLTNFKNYASAEVAFRGNIHCLLGSNGSGKTNLLDAIHYLSMTRGSVHAHDPSTIRLGENHFSIRGVFDKGGKQSEVTCSFVPPRKKMVVENGKEYQRFSEHIGKYPLVVVAPNDMEVIASGAEARRSFFDTLLSQIDTEYLRHLIVYQSQLRQRNSLLRIFAEGGTRDPDLIATYDEKIVTSGRFLFGIRKEFIQTFLADVQERYAFLTKGSREAAGIDYQSELGLIDFKAALYSRLDQDILLGRTTVGIHRDDFLFTLDGKELKRFGSQGQQKSFLIAMKLAEFDCLTRKSGDKPMLLLDDIFDKLDDKRVTKLMQMVSNNDFGQVFITDTSAGKVENIFKDIEVDLKLFKVTGGEINA